jgi:hypothetical protein
MYKIAEEFPNDIIFNEQGPCISLYQPTHRYSPENKQDTIVFKKLVQQIESLIKEKYMKKDINAIMTFFNQIETDKNVWNNTLDGLAILANVDKCILYKLNKHVEPRAIVADTFYIKPLVRIFQSADKYQLLGLSRSKFDLYEGNRYGLEKIEMGAGTPRTIKEVLGDQLTDPYFTQGGASDEIEKDLEKFFRYVDKFVLSHYSKSSKLPLVLVSVKDNHGIFMKISNNPYLLKNGIKQAYDSLEMKQIKEKAWEIIEPIYLEKTQKLVNKFENAKVNALGSDNLKQIAIAAFESRVETVLIEVDKVIPGKIDYNTGELELTTIKEPGINDILDDLAEFVIKKKGKVVVLPKERMPSNTGVAAIYRY